MAAPVAAAATVEKAEETRLLNVEAADAPPPSSADERSLSVCEEDAAPGLVPE